MELSKFNKVLEEYQQEFEKTLEKNLKEHGRVASGNLIKSITVHSKYTNQDVTVILDSADYLKQVSEGRKPSGSGGNGQLKEKIKIWIEQKNILPRPDNLGKVPTKDQLAFLIARKIHKEGYKGSDDLTMTVDSINDKYIVKLQEALNEDINGEAEYLINTSVGKIIF